MTLGEIIKVARQTRGLSQDALGGKINVSGALINK